MEEVVATVIRGDARRIRGMREEGDGRGYSDNSRRGKDKGRISGYVRFGIRVGTVGFRKK